MTRFALALSLLLLAWAPRAGAQAAAAVIDGKATFDVVCAACHSIDPPHKLAPPMSHVARYYKRHFATEGEFVDAVVQWVLKPEQERSKMPAHVIENFGIMAAFPLPEPQLREVAKYVYTLAAPEPAAAPQGQQQHQHRNPN
jgi:mono/diheme cytochrome c family protein